MNQRCRSWRRKKTACVLRQHIEQLCRQPNTQYRPDALQRIKHSCEYLMLDYSASPATSATELRCLILRVFPLHASRNFCAAPSMSESVELILIPKAEPRPASTTPTLILIARLSISSVRGYAPFP